MRRTQLYLEDDLWAALHDLARSQKSTVSELVRTAARDRYLGNHETRRQAMMNLVGIRAELDHSVDSTEFVRSLREDSRMERLQEE